MPARITWCDDLSRPGDLPAVAVVDLADPALAPLQNAPAPEGDLCDIGRRTGVDAKRFLARRALLRCWIGRLLPVEPGCVAIRYDSLGRPTLDIPGHALRCSVTARGDWAGFALAKTAIGIDLEPLDQGPVAWAALSANEHHAVEALPPERRGEEFLRLWTLKEAYLKACGTGLSGDPAELDFGWSDGGASLHDRGCAIALAHAEVRSVHRDGRDIIVAAVMLPV